jgi:hypothetical protein
LSLSNHHLGRVDDMDDDLESKSGLGPLTWVSLLVLVPCLYVLSIGPVVAVAGKNRGNAATIRVVYAPVFWLHNNTPMKKPLEMYAKLWGWS